MCYSKLTAYNNSAFQFAIKLVLPCCKLIAQSIVRMCQFHGQNWLFIFNKNFANLQTVQPKNLNFKFECFWNSDCSFSLTKVIRQMQNDLKWSCFTLFKVFNVNCIKKIVIKGNKRWKVQYWYETWYKTYIYWYWFLLHTRSHTPTIWCVPRVSHDDVLCLSRRAWNCNRKWYLM